MRMTRWLATWVVVGALALGIVQSVGAQQTITLPTITANAGSNFAYSGGGFTPGEPISLWMTPPDGSMQTLDAQNADGNGKFTTNVVFPSAGSYQVTALGLQSGREVIAGFNVSDGSSAGAPGANVIAVHTYSSFTFTSRGFNAGESVAISQTQPDGTVSQQDNVVADGTGLATAAIGFDQPGAYSIVAQGTQSHVVVIQNYIAA